jgi:hypothetical protein
MFVTAPRPGGMLRTVPMTWWAALSVGAAAIHFAVIPDHLAEWWAFGLSFAVLGWFQAVWPILYLDRPSRPLAWTAIVVNLAAVGVWAWSRTAGLPVGPEPGMPEAIGAADLVATVFELALAVGLLGVVWGSEAQETDLVPAAGARTPMSAFSLAIWLLVAGLSTVAIALGSA